ncbi:MAG: hypothetical protein QGI45_03295 [Myxococcota bacterium]|jgi:hypothetical protein|nr:hypothetical protein [Myxococcota bacterium]
MASSAFWLSALSMGVLGKMAYGSASQDLRPSRKINDFNRFALESVQSGNFSARLNRAEHAFAAQALRQRMGITKN